MVQAITTLVLSLVVVGLLAYRRQQGFILAARDSANDASRLAARADQRAADALTRVSALSRRLGADR